MTLSSPPAGPMLAHLADNMQRQCHSDSLRSIVVFLDAKFELWSAQYVMIDTVDFLTLV